MPPSIFSPRSSGEVVVRMMTEGRGFSNTRRELGWEQRYPSWARALKKGWRDPTACFSAAWYS
jgi:hypothetical protein